MREHFKVVFFSVLFLTVLCGFAAATIAYFGDPTLTPPQNRVFETLITLFMMGAGALFGLVGGKGSGK